MSQRNYKFNISFQGDITPPSTLVLFVPDLMIGSALEKKQSGHLIEEAFSLEDPFNLNLIIIDTADLGNVMSSQISFNGVTSATAYKGEGIFMGGFLSTTGAFPISSQNPTVIIDLGYYIPAQS